MKFGSFLKLVEIQTKVASITPFLLGTVFTLYFYDGFNVKNFFLMLVSLLSIDMCTTAINNYIDYKTARKREGYGYEKHNAIVRDNLTERQVLITIFILLGTAVTFGILLFLNTNIVVLLLGMLSFFIGIVYTFGPIPISRTPFGEILSGGTMGFIIPFLAVYIHVFDQDIINISLSADKLSLVFAYKDILRILLISIPAATGITNIMLANNICDIEDDIVNKRYTLPIYIGKKAALAVFRVLYYLGFAAIVLGIILKALPLTGILSLLTFIIVQKNLRTFDKTQLKNQTFVLAIQNFVIVNVSLVLTAGLGVLFNLIF